MTPKTDLVSTQIGLNCFFSRFYAKPMGREGPASHRALNRKITRQKQFSC